MNEHYTPRGSIYTRLKKMWLSCLLLAGIAMLPGLAGAQVINEGFEESQWVTSAASTSSTLSVNCVNSASINNGQWMYRVGMVQTSTKRNGNNAFQFTNNTGGYVITPMVTQGVTQVVVYVYALGSGASVVVGVNTNTSAINSTATGLLCTTAANATGWATMSTFNTANGLTVNSWCPVTITANATGSAFVKVGRNANQFVVDDIVVTGAASAPTVSTTTASSITATTASSGGNATADGGSAITSKGVKWGTSSPASAFSSNDGTGTGAYSSSLTSLTANTKYFYRAYATNAIGTGHGTESNFTTLPEVPSISGANETSATASATSVAFTAYWTAPTQGSETFTYSLDWSTDNTFMSGVTTVNNISSASTSQSVSGLSPSTTYYYRVKTVNTTGSSAYTASSAGTATTGATPTITVGSITGFGNQTVNSTSTEKNYSVSGQFLTNDISIAPPAGFEISTGTGMSFVATNPIVLAQSGGTVNATTIYVRFVPGAVQAYSDNIAHTSTGATSQNVAVTGTGVAVNPASGLSINHRSDNIQRLTWTAPTGSYDNVLVFAHASSPVSHTPSGAGSAYNNANANIGSAGVYSTDNYLVYAGTGTSVEVTGLSNATTYHYSVVAYSGNAYSSAVIVNGVTAVQPATSFTAGAGNTTSNVTWTNPTFNGTQTNYWDEVLVVAHSGSAVAATPSGDGSTYTANTAFGSGTDIGTGDYVVYKGTGTSVGVTGLTNGTAYHYAIFTRHGTVWSAAAVSNATPVAYAVGDYGSVASADWSVASTWKKWDGSGFNTNAGTAPTTTDNVHIVGGFTVTVGTTNMDCGTLHVTNGTLKSNTLVSAVRTVRVAGNTVEVTSGGTVGNGLNDDAADGISLQLNSTGTVNITGTGGVMDLSRLILNGANSTVNIDRDVTVRYHGSGNAGNASSLYPTASGITLNINSGKTVTMAKWSGIYTNTSSHTNNATTFTMNINGTLTFEPGRPTGNVTTFGWANSTTSGNSYFVLNTSGAALFTVAVGATGTLNATEFYPNGTVNGGTAGTGNLSTVTVAAGGVINIDSIADFRNASQVITGAGTVNIRGGALRIGSADGITSASAFGPIQTTTRNYNAGATYRYEGTTQVTGDGLPATIGRLIVNNTALTLSGSTNATSGVTLTAGTVTIGANTLGCGALTRTSGVLDASNASGGISFTGSSAVSIPTGTFTGNIGNFTVNNSAGATLNESLTVTGTLAMTSGILTLGANNIVANASSGGSATSYVRTNSSGAFKQPVAATNVFYPVGNTSYNPITLNNSGTADNFSVTVGDDLTSGGTSGTTVPNPCVQRTWFVAEDVVGGSNVTMTLQWNTGSSEINTFDPNHVYIVHHNSTYWEDYLGVTQPYQVGAANSLGGGAFNVSQSGITSFSPFGVASDGPSPLLIQIAEIKAANKGKVNEISWTTRTEDAGDYMELQRSVDARSFQSFVTIAGKGSNTTYTQTDARPFSGVNYYRLKLIDKAGVVTYSKVVLATVSTSGTSDVVIYPNPVTDKLNIERSGTTEATVIVTDLTGRVMGSWSMNGSSTSIDLSKFAAGNYMVLYTDAAGTQSFKISK